MLIVKTLGEQDLGKKVFLTVFSRTSVVAGCACHVILESGTTPGRGTPVSQNLPLFHLQSRLENFFSSESLTAGRDKLDRLSLACFFMASILPEGKVGLVRTQTG
jgi:hypothetical protein